MEMPLSKTYCLILLGLVFLFSGNDCMLQNPSDDESGPQDEGQGGALFLEEKLQRAFIPTDVTDEPRGTTFKDDGISSKEDHSDNNMPTLRQGGEPDDAGDAGDDQRIIPPPPPPIPGNTNNNNMLRTSRTSNKGNGEDGGLSMPDNNDEGLLSPMTNVILRTLQQSQNKSRDNAGVASSLRATLTQLASLGPQLPPNFEMTPTPGMANGCLQTPGKLNKFLAQVARLLRPDDDDDDMDSGSSEANLGGTGHEVMPLGGDEDDKAVDDNLSEDSAVREKRESGASTFDIEDTIDDMDTDNVECLRNFMSEYEQEDLCSLFSKRSSDVFAKLYASGFMCHQKLSADELDDDGLDMQHQIIMASQFRGQPFEDWSDDEVKKLIRFAPDALGEDFIDELPENLFRNNLKNLGRLAAGKGSNPSLREAFRDKLEELGLETLSEEGLQNLGPGLLALSRDQLMGVDGRLFLDAEIDRFLEDDDDDDDDDNENASLDRDDDDDDSDDDDDDEDDGFFTRYTIGQQMKKAINNSVFGNARLIARTLPLLNDDIDFIRKLNPDALFDALPQLQNIDFDHEEAVEMIEKLREHSDILRGSKKNVLKNLGQLAKGLYASEIEDFEMDDFEEALEELKDIDFDDDQAEAVVGQILNQIKNPTFTDVVRLGKLAKGLSVHQLQQLGPQDLLRVVDVKGLHFNLVKQNLIAEKLRRGGFSVQAIASLYETFTDDDLEDLFEDNESKFLELAPSVKWKASQAVTVARLYRRHLGNGNIHATKLSNMGHAAVGLLPSDIDDMSSTDDDTLDLIEILNDAHEELNSVQIDKLVEKFEDAAQLDSDSMAQIGQKIALQGGTIMAYLDDEDFSKLEFDAAGKAAFLAQIYKMTTNKMSRSHLGNLARNIFRMMDDDKITPYSRLRALGETALGLTPDDLDEIGGKALIDNMDILRKMPFSRQQARAILSAIDRDQPDWTCRSDILARLGPLLQHADDDMDDLCMDDLLASMSAVMKGLDRYREAVEDRMEEGFGREDSDAIDEDGIARLVEFMIKAYITPRATRERRSITKRQATNETLSCSLVQQLRGSVSQIPQEYLQTLPPSQLSMCLGEVGSVSDWKPNAVQTLIEQLKQIEGNPSEWREETVRRAGSLVSGLKPQEIQQLQINGVDTLNSIGKHRRLDHDQLKAGVQRWITLSQKQSSSDITEGELASMSEFVCGMGPSEITLLSNDAFKRSLASIGQTTSCSAEQRSAYVNKLVSIHGDNIKQWEPVTVAEAGHLLGYLGQDRLQMLTSDQLSLVSPTVIKNLPMQAISSLSKRQLKALGTNQINALTEDQFYSLSPSQQEVVAPKATVAFHHQDNGASSGPSVSVALGVTGVTILSRLVSV